jgi:hypothetical protein
MDLSSSNVLHWETPIRFTHVSDNDRAALAWRTSDERVPLFAADCRRITSGATNSLSPLEQTLVAPVVKAAEAAAMVAWRQDGDPCHTLHVLRAAMEQMTTVISLRRDALKTIKLSIRAMPQIPGVTPELLRLGSFPSSC